MQPSAGVTPEQVARPFRLRPFRALRLQDGRVGLPSSGRLLARPYRSVAKRMREWQERGQVRRDAEPGLYLHEYTVAGITVRGLVGALELSSAGGDAGMGGPAVLPHEGVHPEQVAELAERMHQMGMNPAPILLVHRGPAAVRSLVADLLAAPPQVCFTDHGGQQHRIWAITDPGQLAVIEEGLASSQALIADGHHRYAAYLQLRDSYPGTGWEQGLVMLVDHDDTPLFLGAIHRFLPGVTLDQLAAAAERVSGLRVARTRDSALGALDRDTLVVTDGEEWLTVGGVSTERTAVETFHHAILGGLASAPRVAHHHTVHGALREAATRPGLAVLLPAADLDSVVAASRDRLLPEKATSFQPKPHVGLLMRIVDDRSSWPT